MSKCGDFSYPYFPVISQKKRKYGTEKTSYLDIFLHSDSIFRCLTEFWICFHSFSWKYSLCEKWPNTEFFLVRIFPYSVQIWENTDQKIHRIWTLFMQWLQSDNLIPPSEITLLWFVNFCHCSVSGLEY